MPGFHLHALPLPHSPFFNHLLQNDTKKLEFLNILGNHLLETRENVCYNLSCLFVHCYFRDKQMHFLTIWCLLPLGG